MSSARKLRKVAVLKGGPSKEREVSLRSGAAVATGLREAGYDVIEIDVKDCTLDLPPGVEGVFIALHGEFGEDGQVQRLLRARGVPYTGSSPESSALAFDKKRTKAALVKKGIPTPEYEVLVRGDRRKLALPVVVKPARQGSSLGVYRVFSDGEWEAALTGALAYDNEVIVEKYIEGRELTVGIVGKDVLPVVEIVAPDGWYSFDAKYSGGRTRYLVPAPLSLDLARECSEVASRTFAALGSRGMGRVDVRLATDGKPYVLELNNIPGFTATSLLPKAAQAAGIGFAELCDKIMRLATFAC